MRSRATVLVAAAVGLLAVAAAIDALPSRDGPSEPAVGPATTAAAEEDSGAGDLARAGVFGTLFVAVDAVSGCDYRAFALPSLDVLSSARLRTCRFQVAPDARHLAEARGCPAHGVLRVFEVLNPVNFRTLEGCAPAWDPNGTFTYVSRGAMVRGNVDCLQAAGCLRTAIPRRDLAAGLRRLGTRIDATDVAAVHWLTPSRVAIVARDELNADSIVFFDGRRAVQRGDFAFSPGAHLEVVRDREEIFIGGRGQGGLTVFNFEGGFVAADRVPFRDGAAIAHSPDGRWLALARPDNVCIYPTRDPEFPVGCIPRDAKDLAWR